MTASRRRKLTGLLYLTPAVLFVLVFTAYPLIQMVRISFTNWSLITAPEGHRSRQLHGGVRRRSSSGARSATP